MKIKCVGRTTSRILLLYDRIQREMDNGRMPKDMTLHYFDLESKNAYLYSLIEKITLDASAEVVPEKEDE